jgi:protease-4
MLNGMSPEAREDWGGLVTTLWDSYQKDVIRARRLPADALTRYIEDLQTNLAAVGGDGAELALRAKLVDKVATEDEMEAAVVKVVGEANHSFRQVDYLDYLNAVDGENQGAAGGGGKVGVVVAAGDILPGEQPPGSIGGESTAQLIRNARYDDSIRALVLRVDSPGGSTFASDLILREVELTKKAGKPVVISMGSVAASGGYWISMAGDEIFASPDTITGSIGIFGMLPTFQDSLAKIGVHSDGVGTTPLSDAFDITRPMSKEMRSTFQAYIDHGYQEFIGKVAKYRHLKLEEVDAIAQGRVWSGSDAKRIGLVDKFGDLDDAIAAAAKRAELGQHYSVQYIEKPLSFSDRLLIGMADDSNNSRLLSAFARPGTASPWYGKLLQLAQSLDVFSDPRGAYAYCFCDVR